MASSAPFDLQHTAEGRATRAAAASCSRVGPENHAAYAPLDGPGPSIGTAFAALIAAAALALTALAATAALTAARALTALAATAALTAARAAQTEAPEHGSPAARAAQRADTLQRAAHGCAQRSRHGWAGDGARGDVCSPSYAMRVHIPGPAARRARGVDLF